MVEDFNWGWRSNLWVEKHFFWIVGTNFRKKLDFQILIIFFGNCYLYYVGPLTIEYIALSWEQRFRNFVEESSSKISWKLYWNNEKLIRRGFNDWCGLNCSKPFWEWLYIAII